MERKELKFEVLNDLGTISESTKGWSKKLTRIIWNEDEPKYDIRAWDSEFKKMGKGITLTEKELRSLKYLIDKELDRISVVEGQNVQYGQSMSQNLYRLFTEAEKIRENCFNEPLKNLGHFLIKGINDGLGVDKCIDFIGRQCGHKFSLAKVLSTLIYARIVDPCSKKKTFEEVLPELFDVDDVSLEHIYDSLPTLGETYEEIIDVYNKFVEEKWGRNFSHTYFDCTNFYFEIDYEDEFRRKGPSKENRHDPIVGMGLLLDADRIPIGMKMYPGNQSEKPIIREVIQSLKKRHSLNTKTVRVADKGLNCAENIYSTAFDQDGYIFSKSVKQLPQLEQTWILLDRDYKEVKNSDGTLKYKYKEWTDKFPYSFKDKDGKTISFEIY